MRGQHRPIPWHESAVELDALYQQECNDQRRVRSQALWLLRQGHTIGTVSGLDLTGPYVVAARKLTALLQLSDQVTFVRGDAQHLPYAAGTFDGAYSQHVTMNIADRAQFFREAWRVLRPGAFFALTEHGLGPAGRPHHPVPWSEDGQGEWLVTPAQTRALLTAAGFGAITIAETGTAYLAAYRQVLALAAQGTLPPLGPHLLTGRTAPQKVRNAARNIAEGRTQPVQVICRKPPAGDGPAPAP
jgi:SAM-dependent methyltransferase